MVEIEFTYNGKNIIIQCKKEEKMEDIIKRFMNKENIKKDKLFFIYSGNNIDTNLKYEELVNEEDKKRNKLNILVYDINDNNIIKNTIIKYP